MWGLVADNAEKIANYVRKMWERLCRVMSKKKSEAKHYADKIHY